MNDMTSRQRLLAALRREPVDRVPYLESVIDEPVALEFLGIPVPADLPVSELGADGEDSVVAGTALGTPRYSLRHLVSALGLDGFGAYFFARPERIDLQVGGHTMTAGGRIKNRADFNRIVLPDPDDPAIYAPLHRFLAEHQDSTQARFCLTNLCSDPVILGMGFEHFAASLYDDPVLVGDLFSLYAGWHARVAANLSRMDFDFLWFADDIAFKTQPYVSPKTFRQVFMPHYRRVVEQISKPWIFHSDGNLMPILADLLSLGMDGLHPIEPAAMDIRLLKQRYGGQVCLVGGIDLDLLSRGTPEQVEACTRQVLAAAAPGGGYIAGSSNSIPYYCQAKNVAVMRRAVARYGQYPLRFQN
jgi:uroporphyrinogen decarboxylase